MTQTFRDIIDLWPSPDALAGEVGSKAETVRKWRQRDSIPAEWWLPVIEAGKTHGHDLTTDAFAGLAARSKAGEVAA